MDIDKIASKIRGTFVNKNLPYYKTYPVKSDTSVTVTLTRSLCLEQMMKKAKVAVQ